MIRLNSSEDYELYFDNAELIAEGETLEGDAENDGQSSETQSGDTPAEEPSFFAKYGMFILLGALLVLIVVWMLFSGRKGKQRQKEYAEQLDAIRPGHKVKTAGGICGIVVEVCDDNTVILETGSETSGKSCIKIDKELIAQTDAKGPTQQARERAEAERKAAKEDKEKKKTETESPAVEEPDGSAAPADEPAPEQTPQPPEQQ